MRKLILLIALLSTSVFAEPPPPATAFKGTMYGYEVAIYVNEIFGAQYGLRTTYKVNGEWVYLSEPSFYESEIDTKEKADDVFIAAIAVINIAAYNELSPITMEPDSGLDRMQWILENSVSIVDNQIIVGQ